MNELLITEISEKDFRKLDIEVYCHERTGGTARMEKYKICEILDHNINLILNSGWDFEKEQLIIPVTIAIHKDNNGKFSGYWDKYMNQFSGMQTFQMGWGIKHLYSTRDYLECHDDYWRVSKKETAVVYRVHLDPSWSEQFVLKHKKEITEKISDNEWYETFYDLDEFTGEWKEGTTSHVIKEGKRTTIEPVSSRHEPDKNKMA